MNKSEKALDYYSKGFNCAQSVIASFADILEVDEETAVRMAAGFGGGMGRLQETCGAVTGAFMVIGYLRGKYKTGDDEANKKTNRLIQEFSKRFTKEYGSINCKALIKFDINSEEGMAEAKEADVFNKKCTYFVKTAVELLEEAISK
ncbi:MAG: C-GCAxxG-C-C family protein [Bacteroidales bacterium]|nr:C-GCAxxG-C-C family protein [Bacteroidales bacterium]